MSRQKLYFNTCLAKPRIKTEHCIGLLKARFHFFKRIRIRIATKGDLKRIIQYFMCCVILHNLLVDVKEADIDEQLELPDVEDDELDVPVRDARNDGERRRQIFAFLLEAHGGL
ncbi:MAG: transposase family protein [Gaiellaceae bacterium]